MSAGHVGDLPADWPSIERPSRRRVWWWRAAAVMAIGYVVTLVVLLALAFPHKSWWARGTGVAGAVMLAVTALYAWRLAVRPRRLLLGRGRSAARPVVEERKVLRRALLRGEPIRADSLRDVAMLAAAETRTPIFVVFFLAVVGNNALSVYSASAGPASWLVLVGLTLGVAGLPLMGLGLVQSRRIRRAAMMAGAAPIIREEASD